MLYAIIGMLVIIADQYIKFWVGGHIALGSPGEEIVPGILSLVNVHNDGAAFGVLSGSGARIPFIILAGVFTIAVIIALATRLISGKLARWSIVMVTAGGLSNCLDRVMYGYVQDMFKLEFINFPVFNLADVFITVFAVLFALAVIFGKTRKKYDDEDDEFEDDEEEPRRAPRRKAKKQQRRRREEDEDDEDEDEEDLPPVRKPRKQPKKQRAAAAREDRNDEKASAPARRNAQQAVRQPKAAAGKAAADGKVGLRKEQTDDPFAGWEKPAERPAPRKVKPAAGTASADRPAAKADTAAAAKSAQRSTAARPAAAKPAERPAPKPAPKPAAKPAAEEEFSLDDILNEFK